MKKTHILLVAFVLVLAMVSIPNAYAHHMYEDPKYRADRDHFDPSTAIINLGIFEVGSETVRVTGPTVVERWDPYDPDDGHWTIDTEIISMDLVGTSVLVGPIRVRVGSTFGLPPSTGKIIQQTPGVDFPADSFFDVFFEIKTTLAYPFSTLRNDDPVRMSAVIYDIPPWEATYTSGPTNTTLKNEEGSVVGIIRDEIHKLPPRPPPVGGVRIDVPFDKFSLLAPYIGLASTILVATATTAIYAKRVKHRKKKQ